MFAEGQGLKDIATVLTAADIPSPSAHDPERNRHRDPRGWGHTAIRSILLNERYLGQAVWGKQARTDELFDLDDVAAGYVTRQRWTDSDRWVYGPRDAHPALIDQALWDAAAARLARQSPSARPGTRSPRTTSSPYVLRGLLHCGICDRKMQGSKSHDILRYRCLATQTRALPAYLAHHPKSVYVRERDVVAALDRWLPTLADAELLAASQEPEPTLTAQVRNLRHRLTEIDKATRNLISAIELGTDPTVIHPRLDELRAERSGVTRRLTSSSSKDGLTAAEIDCLLGELGGLTQVLTDAAPGEKVAIYQALGLRLTYQPADNVVVATADLGRVLSGVGGGT